MRAARRPQGLRPDTESVHEACLKIDRIMRMSRPVHDTPPRSMELVSTLNGRVMYTRTSNSRSKDSD